MRSKCSRGASAERPVDFLKRVSPGVCFVCTGVSASIGLTCSVIQAPMIPRNVRDHRDDSACGRDRMEVWRKVRVRSRFCYRKSYHGHNLKFDHSYLVRSQCNWRQEREDTGVILNLIIYTQSARYLHAPAPLLFSHDEGLGAAGAGI